MIYIVLHPNKKSVTNFVRGRLLEEYGKIKCIEPLIWVGWLTKIQIVFLVIKIFIITTRKDKIIIVKPWSIFFIKLMLKLRRNLYIDINDPLHLDQFLGIDKFSKLIKFFNKKIIFESIEYKEYCNKNFNVEGYLIEDYSQKDFFKIPSWSDRLNRIIWFGDKINSKRLLDYKKELYLLTASNKWIMVTIGADESVIEELKKFNINIICMNPKNRQEYREILSYSKVSIILFKENEELDELRGNLKLKFSMAAGCFPVATNIKMHQRLIRNGFNGVLLKDKNSLLEILNYSNDEINKIASQARETIELMGSLEDKKNEYLNLP